MRLRPIAYGVVALSTMFGLLSGCGSSGDPVALTVKASSSGGTYAFNMPKKIDGGTVALTVKASSSGGTYAFNMPKKIDGGTVALTLDNTDSQPHELGMIRVKPGTTQADVTSKILDTPDGAPIPDVFLDSGGVGFAAPGQKVTATQKLAPGTYVYFCTFGDGDAAHYKHGMLGTVTVTGTKGKGGLGDSVESITAKETTKAKYGFDVSTLKAGRNKLLFKNDGPNQIHHAQLFPIAKGSSFADVKAFFESDSQSNAAPPVDFEHGSGTTVLAPGQSQVVDLTLAKGNYVVLCFLNDRAGGPPHFTKGMLQEVTVK